MKIKNFDDIAKSNGRKIALQIAEAGLQAIDTEKIIKDNIRIKDSKLFIKKEKFDLNSFNRIFVVGVGKCALSAGGALEDVLGERISGGIVIDVCDGSLKKIKVFIGDHPFPSERNISATKELISLLNEAKENDLVIVIVSGGGSSLLCQPENITCVEEKKIVESLVAAGAPIQKINTVRKHLSLAKGGFLARYAYPAQVVGLIFSDVPGDDINFVASGPTVKDKTTIDDARDIFYEYDLYSKCPFVENGLIETPKENIYFKKVKNILMVSSTDALDGMKNKIKDLGLKTKIIKSGFSGNARDVGEMVLKDLHLLKPRVVNIYGGESTVVVKKPGKGGRNQEFVLYLLDKISNDEIIIAFASDGIDNTDIAGGICDIITREKAISAGLDLKEYLENNNAYGFFMKTGDYLMTGNTGSNVSDLIVALRI